MADHGGEVLDTIERIVVSPVAGVFMACRDLPRRVTAGAALGHIRTNGDVVPVVSPFDGELIDVVALDGERLEIFQRVAWLRARVGMTVHAT